MRERERLKAGTQLKIYINRKMVVNYNFKMPIKTRKIECRTYKVDIKD